MFIKVYYAPGWLNVITGNFYSALILVHISYTNNCHRYIGVCSTCISNRLQKNTHTKEVAKLNHQVPATTPPSVVRHLYVPIMRLIFFVDNSTGAPLQGRLHCAVINRCELNVEVPSRMYKQCLQILCQHVGLAHRHTKHINCMLLLLNIQGVAAQYVRWWCAVMYNADFDTDDWFDAVSLGRWAYKSLFCMQFVFTVTNLSEEFSFDVNYLLFYTSNVQHWFS